MNKSLQKLVQNNNKSTKCNRYQNLRNVAKMVLRGKMVALKW